MERLQRGISLFILFGAVLFGTAHFVGAQESVQDVDALNAEISNRKSEIEQIRKKMDAYQAEIRELSGKQASLLNDLQIIENQVALTELDVEATRAEIASQTLEIQVLQERIQEEQVNMDEQKAMIKAMLFEMQRNGRFGMIEVLFGSDDFSELFSEVEHLESVNRDLNSALRATYLAKTKMEETKAEEEERLENLVALEDELETEILKLQEQRGAKDTLIHETQQSEVQYRVLMSELRQEQQYITNQISSLQLQIEERLAEVDSGDAYEGEAAIMSHPLPSGRLTASFHDPTYPFRHLFEHSGVDLAAPTGTPIRSAAPGVVAWTRTGQSYGNYVMIIHAGGYATLYAHMSSFNVVPDQFVSRGQVIGGVGSTGFSTGPHLHFEVRYNGIPVNPFLYIVN